MGRLPGTLSIVSTLTEIEEAVAGLPVQEQRSLLAWLAAQLESSAGRPEASDRTEWLRELAEFRQRISTGQRGAMLQEIMDDLRGDR